jgi:asparagine synthase (glutamine-hydrolysing)
MTRAIAYRGPDDEGYFQDGACGVYLGHRRLSIVDLSPEGHQPMLSQSGRYMIVFNGEVYNHGRLRVELEDRGICFRGHSDTEVMLAAIETWGLRGAIERFIGMFAFALWDRHDRELILARDRLGIKPLYYGWVGKRFVFGSEIRSIAALPDFANPVEHQSLMLMLRYGYIAAPHTIYRDIYKLLPGTLLHINGNVARGPGAPETLAKYADVYWSARTVAENGSQQRIDAGSESEACEILEDLLRDAVGLRMLADVPLGAFLSGGVDSTAVVALMQSQSGRPVRTFSIGFHESGFDEAPHARAVARHLGTDHTELYVSQREVIDVTTMLPSIFDEPFADSSQIPTFLVSQLARRHVTVSLSGDGGDELFAGYNRYFFARQLWNKIGRMPKSVRKMASSQLRAAPGMWTGIFKRAMPLLPPQWQVNNPAAKIESLASILVLESKEALYDRLLSHWRDPDALLPDTAEPRTSLNDPEQQASLDDYTERMMYCDLVNYLPDDVLVKVDRASMAVSLEARVPLLDHRVVEFAWRLPLSMKISQKGGKQLLRKVLYKYVPPSLIERPKQGFGVPMGEWLRGPLRDWAEDLLDARSLGETFNAAPIRATWDNHLQGRDAAQKLWNVLMFQAWLKANRREPAVPTQLPEVA